MIGGGNSMLIALILALLLILSIVSGIYFSNVALKPKTRDYNETYEYEQEKGRIIKEEYEKLPKEEFYIKSPYGYNLHTIYFPNGNSKKTIIIAHGITYNLFGSVKYMSMFYKRGFNILIYDHRFHGKSEGDFCSFGFYEKYDLKSCTDWVLERNGKDSIVGLHGESMGAATVLQNLAIDERISFCIADCPYSNLFNLLRLRLKLDYHLVPFPVLYISNIVSKIRYGVYLSDISPIRDIQNVEIPIFFVHGQNDNYIPHEMSVDMFNIKKGVKKLYLAPNSDHAESYWNNQEEYDKLVGDFLEELNIK